MPNCFVSERYSPGHLSNIDPQHEEHWGEENLLISIEFSAKTGIESAHSYLYIYFIAPVTCYLDKWVVAGVSALQLIRPGCVDECMSRQKERTNLPYFSYLFPISRFIYQSPGHSLYFPTYAHPLNATSSLWMPWMRWLFLDVLVAVVVMLLTINVF